MGENVADTKRLFISAMAEHFGLPGDQVMMGSRIQCTEELYSTFEVVFHVAITEADLIAASKIMERYKAQGERHE